MPPSFNGRGAMRVQSEIDVPPGSPEATPSVKGFAGISSGCTGERWALRSGKLTASPVKVRKIRRCIGKSHKQSLSNKTSICFIRITGVSQAHQDFFDLITISPERPQNTPQYTNFAREAEQEVRAASAQQSQVKVSNKQRSGVIEM